MNSKLPPPVAEQIDAFRHAVQSANIVDGKTLRANAASYVLNALALVNSTPDMERAAAVAVEKAVRFADGLANILGAIESGRAERERARQDVIQAIDELRESMADTTPSARASALGIAW